MSALSFLLMGIDKYKARKEKWRISEKTLLLSALLGGSPGTLLGMLLFHHKIRKPRFFLGVPAILILYLLKNHISGLFS
ncbi:MAG: DUF1294 domain-containing protein [Erysipelotrichaceae bacterium]|nr:DUF1294 domain-containing protein [Erysipelotrichaceae bacterium]